MGDDEQDLDGDADLGIDDDIPGAIAGDGVGEGADNAVARMPDGRTAYSAPCPNCHRKMHSLNPKSDIMKLKKQIPERDR